jgi:raffinose/stachyose/melibiose transport system permease protein
MADRTLTIPGAEPLEQEIVTHKRRPPVFGRVASWLSLLGLMGLLMIMLLPLMMITVNSFKTEAEYYANGPFALPETFNLDTITSTWQRTDYTTKLWNSTVISLSVAVLAIGISVLNAFALGIGKVRGRSLFLMFFLLAIMMPPESLIYPQYYAFKAVGLYDTRLSVILVTAVFHSAFGTYLLTTVFGTFSKDLIESAMIDGCNKVQLLFRIIVPLNMPSLSVLFVFFFIWTWNDFFLPLIFLISNANQTVPVAMALATGEHGRVITTQSAAALLGILPCIFFFLLFQRTLTRGITAGSFK